MIAALTLTMGLWLAPQGVQVSRLLATSDLPVAPLAEHAAGLRLLFHRQDAWARAFYVAPAMAVDGLASGVEDGRLLPALRLPRLVLYAPHYRTATGLRPLASMPVDVADHLLRSLLEAYLDPGSPADAGAVPFPRGTFATRAAATMADVPAAQRETAYRAALADFVGNALSLAHEIGRSHARARAAGRQICRLLSPPRAIFRQWQRLFGDPGRYPGTYAEGGSGGQLRWRMSEGVLTAVDKRQLVTEILGGTWTGAPVHDFAHLCPPPVGPQPPAERRSAVDRHAAVDRLFSSEPS